MTSDAIRFLATGPHRLACRLTDVPPTKILDGPQRLDALWVGDRGAARRHGACFRVHTVARDARVDATETYTPAETDGHLLEKAVRRTFRMLHQGGPVLVHCHEGRERAPTVAACIAAAHRGWTIQTALHQVADLHEPTDPPASLVTAAKRVLNELQEVDTHRP